MNSRQHLPRLRLAALAVFAAALLLQGCAAPPQSSSIDRVTLTDIPAPPAPRGESPPPAPYADSYWIPGYWRWDSDKFVWVDGRWEQSRPNMVYQNAYWTHDNGSWIYQAGHWTPLEPSQMSPVELIQVAPPLPREEIIVEAPGPGYLWIGGYWGWSGGRHVWVGGHWGPYRDGYFWAPAHWDRHPNGWAFAGGRWVRH